MCSFRTAGLRGRAPSPLQLSLAMGRAVSRKSSVGSRPPSLGKLRGPPCLVVASPRNDFRYSTPKPSRARSVPLPLMALQRVPVAPRFPVSLRGLFFWAALLPRRGAPPSLPENFLPGSLPLISATGGLPLRILLYPSGGSPPCLPGRRFGGALWGPRAHIFP